MKQLHFNLPKKYLSYSAYNLWQTNKDEFRQRYYEGKPSIVTPETLFGKKIAEYLEHGNKIDGIEYEVAEQRIEVTLPNGLKLLSYLDGFNPTDNSIFEIKTGHLDSKGKVPWNNLKVAKHKQLDWYSMMVKKKFGKVNNTVKLIWLETRFKTKDTEFDGHVLSTQSRELELTGKKEVFTRKIAQWERDKMEQDILRTALEITKDYEEYIKEKNTSRGE